jgi:hypothetical protein
MRKMALTIPIGLGDLIYLKGSLDPVRDQFSEIRFRFGRHIISGFGRNNDYNKFLDDIGQLFFSEPPYILDDGAYPFVENISIYSNHGIIPQKPELAHLLCQGISIEDGYEYIVMTTKLRYFPRNSFNNISTKLWNTLRALAEKYKIVVLGEREVEMNKEYLHHTSQHIYSIYNDIVSNIPSERLVDLTIPALGITSPTLSQVQQDCLIMRNAKLVLTLGVGGNFCMATAVANSVGYRVDSEPIADEVFAKEYPNAFITKDWNKFIQRLENYK